MTTTTRTDIHRYVTDTLPAAELTDWDIDAIVDDMITTWDLIGEHQGRPDQVIDHLIDSEKYWSIVEAHQR